MSRSNPTDRLPNPAVRFFEWNGEKGLIRYFDREAKLNVDAGHEFTFLLLDELSTIKGWHDPSQSAIYSNEIKDISADVLVVKAFKAPGILAEGRYRDIKDRVHTCGGRFTRNCYIAFKLEKGLTIGAIQFKGAALSGWMDFTKAHRGDLYEQAIRISGSTPGKKGRITFHVPNFSLTSISAETQKQALGLDTILQGYLSHYLKRTKQEQVADPPPEEIPEQAEYEEYAPDPVTHDDDDIPF